MGEHVCGTSAPVDNNSGSSSSSNGGGFGSSYNTYGNNLTAIGNGNSSVDTFMPLGRSVHDKIGAIPPVDTAIASELSLQGQILTRAC
jgi:hypothetical protein